jgi:hypothetical protein
MLNRFISLCLLIGFCSGATENAKSAFRGIQIPTSKLSVTRISKNGQREVISDENEVRRVLCSKKVVSRLTHCPASPSSDATAHAGEAVKEPMYPGTKTFLDALKTGQACPLPAPFMQIVDGHCCVGRDPHVWPNFCPTIALIGTSPKLPKFDVNANVDIPSLTGEIAYEKLIPDGVFKIGSPDIPRLESVWKPNTVQLSVYFSLSVAFILLSAYVYSKLDEEATIAAGRKREQVLLAEKSTGRGRRDSISSSSSSSSIDLISPKEPPPASGPTDIESLLSGPPPPQQPTMASSSSVAFGLLPPLPRARSANNSALTTPRP